MSTVTEPSLRRGSVPFLGVLAQSVAHIGPSAAIALFVGFVVGETGSNTWLTFAVTTVIMLMVGYCISHFTRRLANTGDLYGFSTKGGGAGAGIVTAWAQLLFGIVTAQAGIIIFGLYLADLLTNAGVPNNRGFLALWFLLCSAGTWWITYRDVRLSARFMLAIEAFSLLVILFLLVLTLFKHQGSIFDTQQLKLSGFSVHKTLLGTVLIVFAFSGFESSTIFGQEAKHPTRSITQALVGSVGLVGLLFVFSAYVMYMGFEGTKYNLATSASPLADLATIEGVAPFRYVIFAGVAISIFSVVAAVLNSTSRLMFTLSREGLMPPAFSRLGKRTLTPVVGLGVMTAINVVTAAILLLINQSNLTVYGYFSSFAGYGAILAYLIVSLAALGYLYKLGKLRPNHVVVGLIAAAALGYVFYASLVPVQAAPFDWLIYSFFGTVVIVAIVYAVLAARRSPALARVGSSVDKDTAAEQADELQEADTARELGGV
ncbi:MAG TPA: APC family permease [Streptosporangiaceae bacterium]|nr:APC family permease [Streptosporangiaceae bacterium]